ncbi:phosphonate ABC transporter, permease protein PhnE [Oceanidesulfovibrio marinus]|uniref:Phosphonate ABC transporter, permease protein PhnE n=1 Tax=Oceanidesulfovibrio marinus TaxID=370038 RepID=A0A6P1ZEF4_9BACT|nr:phosphonate ABC transporter, permease protein PhnE [Oceanidesulfovibrio marinus]TVM32283.1 phosphonate ABC transporter, permease protein PhnE [Oceanidesulfovibrio marinus]
MKPHDTAAEERRFKDPSVVDHKLLPQRFKRMEPFSFVVLLACAAFFVSSLYGTDFSLLKIAHGVPYMLDLLSRMFPPDFSRLGAVGRALLETFQMALVGTVLGVLFSMVIGILATRSQTPSMVLYYISRGFIALFRTVPDLIWAIIFVVMVGLGPFAGTLAIMVDTIGFCGRFFAEAMEEVDPGPQEAWQALGATRLGVIFCAVIPAALPSFINTALFSLEKATRSSVVLGLVGAGGIGIELKVSMDMFMYDQASTIMLLIFFLVLIVERASTWLRQRVI